jgi:hypothetical protein
MSGQQREKQPLGAETFAQVNTRFDFNYARLREILGRLRNPFGQHSDALLSFSEVKELLKPSSETYKGMRSVPVSLIVGSEGRYKDFTRTFLPRHDKLRSRWMRIDLAWHEDVPLPAVQLYELGGAYFIRDGNHRVSVAVQRGTEFIDAEVTSLGTYFKIEPGMGIRAMEAAVIEYERMRFLSETHIEDIIAGFEMHFTSPGRYDTVLSHIVSQREELKRRLGRDVSDAEAIRTWYGEIYGPALRAIEEQNILAAFPGRTISDLYVWIMQHHELLARKHGVQLPPAEAAASFRRAHKRSRFRRLMSAVSGRAASPPDTSQREPPAARKDDMIGSNSPPLG